VLLKQQYVIDYLAYVFWQK